MLSPLVRVDVLASHEAVEATQRRQRRRRGRRHLAGRRARSGGMTVKRRDRSRRAGMIDAARRWKARATAGCPQAPDLKPQAGPRSPTAQHWRADPTDEARRSCSERPKQPSPFAKMEESQRVGFDAVLRLTHLSFSRLMMHPSRLSLNVVEDRTAFARLPGKYHHSGSKEGMRIRDERRAKRSDVSGDS